jgi:hypothetical protein
MTARLPPKAKRFYEEALTQAERSDFRVALEVEGVDQEIAVLRLRLRTALKQHPEDLPLMLRGVVMLGQALGAKHRLGKQETGEVTDAIREVLMEHRRQVEDGEASDGDRDN